MKKLIILNCFDTYEHRVDVLYGFFIKNGYQVKVITSNFRHFQKKFRKDKKNDFLFINTRPYYKNLSMQRLISHYYFAKEAFRQIRKENPDWLYVFVPPNIMVKQSALYKAKHPSVQLILDLIDLWPETMPIDHFKNLPPFQYWKGLRDQYLKNADLIITECNLYQEILKDKLDFLQTGTLYLPGKTTDVISHPATNDNYISLCYLGSINNIIDIPLIGKITRQLHKQKPVRLHIIGDGEKKAELICEAEKSGAEVIDHGKIYDARKKQEIFDSCDFGLNIMKPSVCVGLTMKSMDYFEGSLPIINNIGGDTRQFIEKYKIGINVDVHGDFKYHKIKRENVKTFYAEHFTEKVFCRNLQQILNDFGG